MSMHLRVLLTLTPLWSDIYLDRIRHIGCRYSKTCRWTLGADLRLAYPAFTGYSEVWSANAVDGSLAAGPFVHINTVVARKSLAVGSCGVCGGMDAGAGTGVGCAHRHHRRCRHAHSHRCTYPPPPSSPRFYPSISTHAQQSRLHTWTLLGAATLRRCRFRLSVAGIGVVESKFAQRKHVITIAQPTPSTAQPPPPAPHTRTASRTARSTQSPPQAQKCGDLTTQTNCIRLRRTPWRAARSCRRGVRPVLGAGSRIGVDEAQLREIDWVGSAEGTAGVVCGAELGVGTLHAERFVEAYVDLGGRVNEERLLWEPALGGCLLPPPKGAGQAIGRALSSLTGCFWFGAGRCAGRSEFYRFCLRVRLAKWAASRRYWVVRLR
ncbi:hypothetical protein K439DRAFT_1625409 [Ramaria rubella]|nr:hypothetical protein K439DRAFT_1625409 [Ramaria rubella]